MIKAIASEHVHGGSASHLESDGHGRDNKGMGWDGMRRWHETVMDGKKCMVMALQSQSLMILFVVPVIPSL